MNEELFMKAFAEEIYLISQLMIRIDISCKKGILTYKLCYYYTKVFFIVMFAGEYITCQEISLSQLSKICQKRWSLYNVTYIDKETSGLLQNAREKEKRRERRNG